MSKRMKRKPQRVVIGTGYFDYMDCRRKILLWRKPLRSDDFIQNKVRLVAGKKILGKRVRLVAEVLS